MIKGKRKSKQLKLDRPIKKEMVEYMMVFPYGRLHFSEVKNNIFIEHLMVGNMFMIYKVKKAGCKTE